MEKVTRNANPSISRSVKSQLVDSVIPGLIQQDISLFGEGITDVGKLNGKWYSALQGGIYREPCVEIIQELEGMESIYGVGQSSWGPTVYGLTKESELQNVISRVEFDDVDVMAVEVDNSGRSVRRV